MSKRVFCSSFAFIVLSLLLGGCAHSDAKLREQLIGTWSIGEKELTLASETRQMLGTSRGQAERLPWLIDGKEFTLASDGKYQFKATQVDTNALEKLTWNVKTGHLVITDHHPRLRGSGTTNEYYPLRPIQAYYKIIRLDDMHLELLINNTQDTSAVAKTNVWRRK